MVGQLKTGQCGKGLLRCHLWYLDDLARLWDRKEYSMEQSPDQMLPIVTECLIQGPSHQ